MPEPEPEPKTEPEPEPKTVGRVVVENVVYALLSDWTWRVGYLGGGRFPPLERAMEVIYPGELHSPAYPTGLGVLIDLAKNNGGELRYYMPAPEPEPEPEPGTTVGRVIVGNVVFALLSGWKWRVGYPGGVRFPTVERMLEATYPGEFHSVVYPFGLGVLMDLAKHTGGKLIYDMPAPDPDRDPGVQ
jgi:hypothetical protein